MVKYEECHYCPTMLTEANTTKDHIVPRGRKGVDERWNIVLSCRKCNSRKADSWPTCKCNKCRKSRKLHWELYQIKDPGR
jgi:HNH endonuclease